MSNKVKIIIVALVQLFAFSSAQSNFCFYQNVGGDYTCQLVNAQYEVGSDFNIIGSHLAGMSDAMVTHVIALTSPEVPVNLQTIPNELFEKFFNLRSLDLSNTNIQFIQKLLNCDSLERLFLNTNQIDTIVTSAFESCTSLLTLNMESNKLTEFDNLIAMLSPTLTNLILRSNSIERLSADSFRGLGQLKVINLDENAIVFIGENSFFYAAELEELSMANNRISVLSLNMFINKPFLHTLNLSNNLIEGVQRGLFILFPNIRTINFFNNLCGSFELLELPSPNWTEQFSICYTYWDLINPETTTAIEEPTTIEIETPSPPPITTTDGETWTPTTIPIELPTTPSPGPSTTTPGTAGAATQSIFTVLSLLCIIVAMKMMA